MQDNTIITIDEKLTYHPGTQRVYDSEATLKNLEGIQEHVGVSRIADITDLDRIGIPIISTIRPGAAKGAISIYSGKGATMEQAHISGMMEAVERTFAEHTVDYDPVSAAYEDMAKEYRTLHPGELILPEPLAPSTTIEWVVGYDMLNGVEVFVPANAVYHPYNPKVLVTSSGTGPATPIFRSNTNGLASGNVLEEAILHAFLEVLERDALSVAEYSKMSGSEIIINDGDGILYDLKKKFDDAAVEVRLWLLPSDTGIYTVVAASDDTELKDPALLVMGAGSHLKPEIAISRALTEVAQSRVVQIHGAREDTDREEYARIIGYDTLKRMNKQWYDEPKTTVSVSELGDLSSYTPAENIRKVLEGISQVADKAIIIDLSHDGISIPVVRAIVPGFEQYTLDRERMGARIIEAKQKAPKPKFVRKRRKRS